MLETDEQMHVYEAETVALPSIRVVLGDVPNPDPAGRRRTTRTQNPRNRELADIVRRIIAHLESNE